MAKRLLADAEERVEVAKVGGDRRQTGPRKRRAVDVRLSAKRRRPLASRSTAINTNIRINNSSNLKMPVSKDKASSSISRLKWRRDVFRAFFSREEVKTVVPPRTGNR